MTTIRCLVLSMMAFACGSPSSSGGRAPVDADDSDSTGDGSDSAGNNGDQEHGDDAPPCACHAVATCCDGCSPRALGATCNDGLECTVGETCLANGTCGGGVARSCDALLTEPQCQTSACTEPGGCSAPVPAREGLDCDDGDRWTGADVCVVGACGGTPISKWVSVSAGIRTTCALHEDGTAECWGNNNVGQIDVPEGTAFSDISTYEDATCGITTDSELRCWGGYPAALAISGTPYDRVQCGPVACCVRTSLQGYVVCFGTDEDGGLDGWTSGPVDVFRFRRSGCAIAAGWVRCWGPGYYPAGPLDPPVGTGYVFAVDGDGDGGCAIREADSTLECWGVFAEDGPAFMSGAFAELDTAGNMGMCGIAVGGSLVCVAPGSLGTPPAGTFTALSVGRSHACAISTAGDLMCWGDNTWGQIPVSPNP